MRITSVHNPRVKSAIRLRERKHREQENLCLIDGVRETSRALTAGVGLREVFVCPEYCSTADAREALAQIESRIEPTRLAPAVFDKLAFGDRCEGIVAVATPPRTGWNTLRLADNGLIGVVEGVEKPGNLGAIVRTADCAGLAGLISVSPRTDFFNPNAIRASLGTVFTVPLVEAPPRETLGWLLEARFQIFAARVESTARSYAEVDYGGRAAIVLGSEATGLSETWTGPSVTPIVIPMRGTADSLNVSAAAAVLFFEAQRQRNRLRAP